MCFHPPRYVQNKDATHEVLARELERTRKAFTNAVKSFVVLLDLDYKTIFQCDCKQVKAPPCTQSLLPCPCPLQVSILPCPGALISNSALQPLGSLRARSGCSDPLHSLC